MGQASFNFMAAVTVCSDFGAQEKKICHCFHFSPFYLPWSDGIRCHDLGFFEYWVSSQLFHSPVSPSSGGFSLSATRVVLSPHLRLLIFLPAILIPAGDSSSPTFHMMYSAQKLKKLGDKAQPCLTPFLIVNQSIVPHPVLTVASWPAYRFRRRKLGGRVLSSLWEFPTVCCVPHSLGFWIANEAEGDVFLEFRCLLYDPVNAGNLISGSSAFLNPVCISGSSWLMYCWSLTWRILSVTLLACEMSTAVQ